LQAATEATKFLQEAQEKADHARSKIHVNSGVAAILLSDAARLNADAQTRLEQIQLYISLAKSTPLKGRWGVGAAAKREDSEQAARAASNLLKKILSQLEMAQDKATRNSDLVEAIIARVSQWQAQTISQITRIERLLTEASIGRD
jgi:hypothetical protein